MNNDNSKLTADSLTVKVVDDNNELFYSEDPGGFIVSRRRDYLDMAEEALSRALKSVRDFKALDQVKAPREVESSQR